MVGYGKQLRHIAAGQTLPWGRAPLPVHRPPPRSSVSLSFRIGTGLEPSWNRPGTVRFLMFLHIPVPGTVVEPSGTVLELSVFALFFKARAPLPDRLL